MVLPVQVVKVFPSAPPTDAPEYPIKQPSAPSVNEQSHATVKNNSAEALTQNGEGGSVETDHTAVTNGVNEPSSTPNLTSDVLSVKPVFKIPKTPRTPLVPLSSESSLDPEEYRYVVKDTVSPDVLRVVPAAELSRPKGLFTTAKLKLLLRNCLYRKSDRHPFAVKVSIIIQQHEIILFHIAGLFCLCRPFRLLDSPTHIKVNALLTAVGLRCKH